MFKLVAEDFKAVMERDPSIPRGLRGFLEVALCAPGFHALLGHRLAHALHRLGVPVIPRLLSLLFRWWTGIEIHPGARIGKGILIDHGSGVVIGESAVVGDRCVIFQGVTLGATGNETRWQRHPILEDHVVVGSGAKVLGPIRIGRGARIGANAVVLSPVPAGATVVGPKAQVVKGPGATPRRSPEELLRRIEMLEMEMEELRAELNLNPNREVAI
ncbi:serine O-acetyltransferase EpsC [Thermanaerovibrio acidaminovorans]|uniref:serine O-acetyltransferase EpsC n=1 Tax=Thermanaerovibrio acidaminovorans TaxID=81462 RepID=UPI002490256A|nr:serine O-acetyltransferase EpsC [Thermanaerovibrio acidaminovorans]